jgi:hypothetical protein
MTVTGCGISHKDTKHTDKYSNNKKETNWNNTMKSQANTFSEYCKDSTKTFGIMYTHIIQGPYNKQYGKTFAHIMSHF